MWYTYALQKNDDFSNEDLARAREYRIKQDEKDQIFKTTQLPYMVSSLALQGMGPTEIANRLNRSPESIIEALHFYDSENPGFLKHLFDSLDEQERKIRSLDISPALYDADQGVLNTEYDDYQRIRDGYERVDRSSDYINTGMPLLVDMEHFDPSLKGWKGTHVGDAEEWFPTLVRDQFINDPGYHYEIQSGELPMFEMEDPHPIDKGEVPPSWIIFTHPEFLSEGKIPPQYLDYRGPMFMSDYPDEGDEFDEYDFNEYDEGDE